MNKKYSMVVKHFFFIFFQTLKECYEGECVSRKFTEPGPQERNATKFKVKLLCRDDSSLVVQIVDDHDAGIEDNYDTTYDTTDRYSSTNTASFTRNHRYSEERQGKGNLYLIKVEHGNLLSEKIVYIVSIVCVLSKIFRVGRLRLMTVLSNDQTNEELWLLNFFGGYISYTKHIQHYLC